MNSIKCVVVGDGLVGKTCLLKRFTHSEFSKECLPTVYDVFDINIEVDGKSFKLSLLDTNGIEDYERLRSLQYLQTDVFIICFSLVTSSSLNNVQLRWFPEVRKQCPQAPIILVGTKMDLRHEQFLSGKETDGQVKGRKVAKVIKAFSYLECSALANIGVKQVFVAAVKAVKSKNKTQSACEII